MDAKGGNNLIIGSILLERNASNDVVSLSISHTI